MNRLEGKVAIVTGAANGQGAAEARLFANEGAKVVATDMQFDKLNQLVNELNHKQKGSAIAIEHNVTSEEDWIQVIEKTIQSFGKIDILINNAGITGDSSMKLENYTIEEWDKVMNVNALGNFLGLKHAVPQMKKNGQGSIVNISSLAGINGIGGASAYAASKGATRTLTKGAAKELGNVHIRVNSIHPGFIETAMINDFTKDEDTKNHLLSQIPLHYLGKSEDVANAALFFASDESIFITGEELIIDGGQSL
ncbi:SDR family NAD(P)-dependent oxidoreductase [Bacillus sp. Marseille-P3800]|uniref:SDR family NAD(P)-dependent oxidoreductase n=1 Tax=Bacillus sp. Marseille-P3800 TaxID=2014782 RepID=UPI000C082D66|nr:SDR family NAD(P)-dependent oxidoreductase [Bacillus sp. Marseille-P3800]